jgi:WD40 repeat protein
VTAHRDPGKVRIWDLAAAEPRQSLEISEPIALLSRGTDLLVGSVDGIISVFQDTEKGFVLARTISTDSGPISSLVAGHGEGYGGSAFAVAEKQVLYVDVASGKAETVREYSDRRLWLHCDYLGQNLVELDGSAGRGYTRQHYLEAHGAYPQKTFHGSRFPYLESPHAGPFWFSAAGLWAGYPPHPHRSFVRVRGLLFYDAADPRVFYILGEDTLVARRLDTSLKEIGTTSVDMPRWFTVMVSNGSTPVDDQPYDRETAVRWACPVTGVSKGDRLFLYFVGARDKKLYRYAGPRPGVSGADRSADEAVPGRVVVGSTVSFQIPGTEGSDATCTVADAPAGMTVKGQTVHWTPTADQLGRQRVKIRVDSGGKTWFFRHSVEVVGRSAAGGGADVELPLHLLGRNPALRDAAESNFLLVLDAGNLSVLNKDATIVVKQVSLPKPYTDIYATEEGYVCLSADGVDLLAADLQTIVRTVNLGFPTVAMACHPEHRLTYVCGLDRRDAADLQTEAKRFVVIDEHTGKWEPLPRILGDTLQVTADGRYLVVGLGILRGVRIPGLSDFLGPLGYLKARFLLTYDVSDGVPAFHEHCSRLLQHRSGPPTAALSHGGNYLGYATVPDAEDRSRPQLAVALARCRDINEIRATVPMERNDAPVTWCFHPFLPLFCVATTGGPIEVFKVSTSRNRVEKVKRISRPELGGQRIVSMRFSPDGTRLVTVVTDAIALDGAETLQSFPFPMNGDDSATAAKGFAELPEKPTTRKPKNLDLPQRPDVRVSDIEGLRAQDTNGNGGGSARDIQRALVRLEALGVEWTGMLISSRGHIISSLTPAVGDISLVVDAKGREIRLPLQVVAMSEKGGLSLLTIEKPLKTPYACLAAPGAEGTPLRLGAYDQLSREKAVCILKQGEITGAVQDVSGFPLFRCSIGGGPELAGAVVFDAVGNAVGFWLAGSDREGIALSAEAARDFLLGLGR